MVRRAAFAFDRTVQKISAVKLNAWFGSPHFHFAAGFGVEKSDDQYRLRASVAVQNPIVVVALAKFQLFVVVRDARADGAGLAIIEAMIHGLVAMRATSASLLSAVTTM